MLPAWRIYFEVRGRYAMACNHLRKMIDALPSSETGALPLAHLRANLSHFLIRANAAESARPLALGALAVAESHRDGVLVRLCTSALGGCAMALGRWNEARTWFERIRTLNVEADDPRGVAAAWNSLALVASYQGDAAGALRCAEQALGAYRQLGNHQGVARSLMNIAQIQATELAWVESRRAAESALHHATLHDLTAIALISEFLLGVACVEFRELDTGRKHLRRAQERCTAEGMTTYAFKAGYYLALAESRGGQRDGALRSLLAAARTAYERGWVEDQLYVCIFIGEWLRDGRHVDAAVRVLRAVAAAPDGISDTATRRLALVVLGTLVDPADGALPFEDVARRVATSDSAEDLLQHLARAAG
jgi:tetratricopeptide (TPR) repeat protein